MSTRVARAGLAFASIAVALLLVEAALALRPAGHCGGTPPFWRPDRDVGWALVPGVRREAAVCRGTETVARHVIEVNTLGQRDRPRTYARTPGRRRVLVLGDSFVEAMQVDLEETFAARLEQRLGVEMLNAGVSGYSTDNELRAFVTRGARYAPDAVLLLVHVGNDVEENGPRLYLGNPHGLPPKPWLAAPHPSRGLALCLAAHRAAGRLTVATPGFLWSSSRLVRATLTTGTGSVLAFACAGATGPPLVPGVPELLGVYGAPETPGWQEAWETTETTLRDLVRRVRATGARIGVVLGPAGIELDPRIRGIQDALFPAVETHRWDYEYPYRRLGELLGSEGVPWLSLVPALRENRARTGRSGYYEWDAHWDAEGHAVVADALAPFVETLLRD